MKTSLVWCLAAFVSLASGATDGLPTTDPLTVFITPYPPPHDINLPGDDTHHFRVRWAVSLDSAGHVVKIEAADNANASVRSALERAVRSWQFVPGSIAGQPAATDTMVTVDVTLAPLNDDKFAVHIDDVRTGGDVRRNSIKPPKYPMDAFHHHHQGAVVLKVDYDVSGRVVSAAPNEGAPAVASELIASAARAVKAWTFSPEVVGGHALAGSAIVPICYEIFGDRQHPPPGPGCGLPPRGAETAAHDNDVTPIQPAAHLQSDVIGHTL